jgi:hypothetical protein
VNLILITLDKPDPEIDRIWAEEARKRWAAYKEGRIPTVSYEDVMAKYRSR